jgi:putative oxidoreductase
VLWAWVVGLVEFFGGLALILGVLTRYAALLLAVNMLVAIVTVHLPHGFFLPRGYEFALSLLGANAALLLGGAGALTLDPYFRRAWRRASGGGMPHGARA